MINKDEVETVDSYLEQVVTTISGNGGLIMIIVEGPDGSKIYKSNLMEMPEKRKIWIEELLRLEDDAVI